METKNIDELMAALEVNMKNRRKEQEDFERKIDRLELKFPEGPSSKEPNPFEAMSQLLAGRAAELEKEIREDEQHNDLFKRKLAELEKKFGLTL